MSVIHPDGRRVEPSPNAFLASISVAMGLGEPAPAIEQFSSNSNRQVLVIDTYELLSPLEGWLLENFLPRLPGNTLVVLASRNAPSILWRLIPAGKANLLRCPCVTFHRKKAPIISPGGKHPPTSATRLPDLPTGACWLIL